MRGSLAVVVEDRPAPGRAIRLPLGLSSRFAARLLTGAAARWLVLLLGTAAFSRYLRATASLYSGACLADSDPSAS